MCLKDFYSLHTLTLQENHPKYCKDGNIVKKNIPSVEIFESFLQIVTLLFRKHIHFLHCSKWVVSPPLHPFHCQGES